MASPRGPVRVDERALAPDLARGLMLLLIALANTPMYLWAHRASPTAFHPDSGGFADRIVQGAIITGVDLRVYPMFAFLFGYGMVQIQLRQAGSGVPQRSALALLRRRSLWLLAFGAAHALLLFVGDILGAYGLAGLVLGWLFLRRTDRTLIVWAAIGVGVLALFAGLSLFGAWAAVASGEPAPEQFDLIALITGNVAESNALAAAGARIALWPVAALSTGLFSCTVPVAILLAFWAARRSVLEEPHRHLPLLRTVATGGIAIGWLGGLPNALHHTGTWEVPEAASWVFSATQPPTGLAAGLGYVALFALVAHRIAGRGRSGRAGAAIAAVGKRSLSCYLAQSVICAPLLAAWGLGLGAGMHSATMAAFATCVWLVTLIGAVALERFGRRGPAEVLLRRLTYRRPGALSDTAATR